MIKPSEIDKPFKNILGFFLGGGVITAVKVCEDNNKKSR